MTSVSPGSLDPYTGKGPDLRGRQIPPAARPVACVSDVVRPETGLDGRPSFGCALVTRSGACDCTTPVRRTTSRGFTYDLAVMLGEGWYGEDG